MRALDESAASARRAVPPLGDELEFMRTIWALDHALQRASKRMEASLGITGPQRLVMRIVGRFPGILAGQLAQILHLHPSTVTGVLKRLEQQGLLARRSDPRDRRRAPLGLTEKGRRIESAAEGTIEAAVRRALTGLPRHKTRHAEEVLDTLARSLSSPR